MDVGGEGIILRDPAAPYQPGRSPGYLKHKVKLLSRIVRTLSTQPLGATEIQGW